MKRRVLVTGGCGFIGTNASLAFESEGYSVLAIDNFSRSTSKINAVELAKRKNIEVLELDIRNAKKLDSAIKAFKPTLVLHLAAQVAVTTSLENPIDDFQINALGSMNLLESLRFFQPSRVIFSSTNKVYGNLEKLEIVERESRYSYANGNSQGVTEEQLFDPQSPYGCSKGAADKYFTDYNRSFGLDTIVLRQSCIYGKRQFGVEDQGWIAWFMISALKGQKVTVYGDGKQVRDALYVDDLCDLYLRIGQIENLGARVFNVGGGADNSISVLELLEWLKSNVSPSLAWEYGKERLGDQKIFLSDNSALKKIIGWSPTTSLAQGLFNVWNWLESNSERALN